MKMHSCICFLSLICVIPFGCGQSAGEFSDALITVKGALDTKYVDRQGMGQLIYQLEVDYPASHIIGAFSTALHKKGWTPLVDDYLNPGHPSSHVRGWGAFVDATTTTPQTIHQWHAQWENSNGDIVGYTLRYSYPQGEAPQLETLLLIGNFMPAALAEEQRMQAYQRMADSQKSDYHPLNRESLNLKIDQMIMVATDQGQALIDFIEHGTKDPEAKYRWRYKPSHGEETSGTGIVYEKYAPMGKDSPGAVNGKFIGRHVTDIGSKLFVEAGPIKLKWSYAGPGSGWLYFNPEEMTVELFSDDGWEGYKL